MMKKKTRAPRRRRFGLDEIDSAKKALEEIQKLNDIWYEDFNIETFRELAEQFKSGTIPKNEQRIPKTRDNLQVIVRKSGEISFHGMYTLPNGKGTSLLLGEDPEMTIERAQPIVRTLQRLADKGIDPQDGLHKRLIRELEKQGDKWRPH